MEQRKPNPVHVYQASYLLAAIVRRIRAKQKAAKEREKIIQRPAFIEANPKDDTILFYSNSKSS